MFKKAMAALLATTLLVGTLAGCGNSGSTTSGAGNGEPRTSLTYGMSAEPSSLDPQKTASMNTFTVTYALYDTLTVDDGQGGYKPFLCDEIKVSEDGLVYTILLDKEVKFHDGSVLTAEDIKFSLDRTIAAGWAFDMTLCIDEVVLVDEKTVEIRLNTPFGGMLGSLASPFFSIMSKNYVEAHDDDFLKRNPMGTGAYKLADWVSGDHITLQANEDYFAGAPAIKTVTFKPITDKNTGLIALETGEIDVFLNVNPTDIPAVEANKNLALYICDAASVLSLNMNIENEKLSDVRVRKAIFAAINKEDIVLGALEGVGTPANSPVPTVCAGYSATTPGSVYDPELAKQLLADAGYANGLTLTMRLKEDNKNQKAAQIIQDQLKNVGITMEIEVMEGGAYTNEIYNNGNYELTIGSWSSMFLDAYSVMYSQFHKDCYGPTGNITHVTSEDLSNLLNAAAQAGSEDKVAAYDAVCANILENAYQLPLVYEQTTITTNAALKGVKANPMGVYMIRDFSF